MSQYKVTFQLSEQELEMLADALYSYAHSELDSDVGTYVSEDVKNLYDKVSSFYVEESCENPAMDSFIAQYGIDTAIKEPEKLEKFIESYNKA